jgi:protocatechuate 3,4-dioxygenase alpha subunit
MTLPITPSQTIGPFSHEAWRWACDASATTDSGAGLITISGVIRDGDGAPITDAMIETWSPASTEAEHAHGLPGFRRVASDDAGAFSVTLARGANRDAGEAAALVTVFARGLLVHQFSAIFLEDDAGLAASALLNQVGEQRRATLVARKTGVSSYAWDIWMQGERETVFFDYTGAA